MYRSFSPCWDWITVHCMYAYHVSDLFICWRTLGLLPLFSSWHYRYKNLSLIPDLYCFWHLQRIGIKRILWAYIQEVVTCLIFWRIAHCFPQWQHHFFGTPTTWCTYVQFLNIGKSWSFLFSYLIVILMNVISISSVVLDFHFPNN